MAENPENPASHDAAVRVVIRWWIERTGMIADPDRVANEALYPPPLSIKEHQTVNNG